MKASHKTIEDELLAAAREGDPEAVASALSTGANVCTDHGISISAAAMNGHAEVVGMLLGTLKEPAAFGVGAALTAIMHGRTATLKTILECMKCSEATLRLLIKHAYHLEQDESARVIRSHAEAGRGMAGRPLFGADENRA